MEVEVTPPTPAPPSAISRPRYSGTVENVFRRFTYRRVALIRAVTQDEKALFRKCNPRMDSLCLYGNIDGSWEVLPPKPFEPSVLPEPKRGINLVRDKMRHLKWLQHISRHSDAWLIRISFFRAANLEARERQRLFSMISMLPTVQEAFVASVTYRRISHQENMIDETKDEDEGCGPTFCASCGDRYHAKGFWVCCTLCKCWSHGKCVKVKADQEELIKNFECPECCAEKRGHD
ncbi:unnamed protein product [Urochloa decumbens]|uniref:PHD finger protein ALFIN-LIKE n=1 Tax=Urochloa decumbens TaxID=240449 RepID=A0ABC8WCX4_9POAL